ncbi:MAG: hypothetical protein LBQ40_01010 [Clostridiales bacterium]|jgi:hypothetical protein|nr:hypothetical protein [Clostridiales bacterium]
MAELKINGVNLSDICETAYTTGSVTDNRAKADINNLKYLVNGQKRSASHPNQQYVTYPSGYVCDKIAC